MSGRLSRSETIADYGRSGTRGRWGARELDWIYTSILREPTTRAGRAISQVLIHSNAASIPINGLSLNSATSSPARKPGNQLAVATSPGIAGFALKFEPAMSEWIVRSYVTTIFN